MQWKSLVQGDYLAGWMQANSTNPPASDVLSQVKLRTWELREMPVSELTVWDESLLDSALASDYGDMDPTTMPPLVVSNGTVVDGNHRLVGARQRGLKTVWAYVPHANTEETVAMNRDWRRLAVGETIVTAGADWTEAKRVIERAAPGWRVKFNAKRVQDAVVLLTKGKESVLITLRPNMKDTWYFRVRERNGSPERNGVGGDVTHALKRALEAEAPKSRVGAAANPELLQALEDVASLAVTGYLVPPQLKKWCARMNDVLPDVGAAMKMVKKNKAELEAYQRKVTEKSKSVKKMLGGGANLQKLKSLDTLLRSL